MLYAVMIFVARFLENFIGEYRTILLIKGRAGYSALLAGLEDLLSFSVLGALFVSTEGGYL